MSISREMVGVLVALAVAVVPLATAAPAAASTRVDVEVRQVSVTGRSDGGDLVRSVVVTVGPRAIRVLAEYDDLQRPETFLLRAKWRTSGTWTGSRLGPDSGTAGAELGCTVGYSIDYRADTMRARIPRSCARGWAALRLRHAGSVLYLDNAL